MTFNILNIKINEEYASLVPPLSKSEYESLKEDIKQNGVQIPIVTNQDGDILDGHHRYKIWIVDLGKPVKEMPKPTIMHFKDKLQEKLFVINVNLKRRHLNNFQQIELALKTKPILEEIAKRNSEANLKQNNKKEKENLSSVSNNTVGRVNKQIGNRVGVGESTVARVETILKKGTEEQIQKLRDGKARIHTEYKYLTHVEKRNQMLAEAKSTNKLDEFFKGKDKDQIKLLLGDIRDQASQIPENSVDLIFTDPPYDMASLPLYGELAKLAVRVLKPGGSLVVYLGHHFLLKAGRLVEEASDFRLKFIHQHIILHSGQREVLYAYNIGVRYKPLYWFVKDAEAPNNGNISYTDDVIKSDPVAKEHHKWEQSPVEAEYMISKITVENQVVLDPFLGGATTAIAALGLNRKFIGIEIEEDTFNIAKSRIAKFLSLSSKNNKNEQQ